MTSLPLAQKKGGRTIKCSLPFLLSFDLRDYPSINSGFVPFGVSPFDPALRGTQGEIFPGFK
jgi:hypothetical protein